MPARIGCDWLDAGASTASGGRPDRFAFPRAFGGVDAGKSLELATANRFLRWIHAVVGTSFVLFCRLGRAMESARGAMEGRESHTVATTALLTVTAQTAVVGAAALHVMDQRARRI